MHSVPQGAVTVLIADKSDAVGERLCALLSEVKGLGVLGQALSIEDTLARVAAAQPTALVLDLHLAQTNTLGVVRSVKALAPRCVVIILAHHSAEIFQRESRRSGADFCFHKATEFEKVVELLRDLAAVASPNRGLVRSAGATETTPHRLPPEKAGTQESWHPSIP